MSYMKKGLLSTSIQFGIIQSLLNFIQAHIEMNQRSVTDYKAKI